MQDRPTDLNTRLAAAAPGGPDAPGAPIAPAGTLASPSGWLDCLKVNAPLPVLLALLPLFGWVIEDSGFVDRYVARIILLVGFNVILAVGLQLINGFSGQFSLGHAGFMAVGAYMAAYPAKLYSHRLQDPAAVAVYYLALGLIILVAGGTLGMLFWGLRASRKFWTHLPAVLMLLIVAWAVADVAAASKYAKPPPHLVWSNAAGLLTRSFGAMTTHWVPAASRVSGWLPAVAREPACFLVLLTGGGLCAAAAGLLVGLPTLRLRGDYLAIATLGMAEIIRILITNSQPLGGALGLTGIPRRTNFAWLYGAALVTIFVVWRVAYSARGRAIQAVREDEVAAAAVGINPTKQKVLAFVLGAFFGGVAGGLYAFNESSITPSYFGLQKSIEIVVIVTLGGLGSVSGAILAAVVLTLLPEILRDPPTFWPWGWLTIIVVSIALWIWAGLARFWRRVTVPWSAFIGACVLWEIIRGIAIWNGIDLSQFRMIIYSLLLVGMMLTRPQGLLGGRELWPRRKRRHAPAADAARGTTITGPGRRGELKAEAASRRFGGLAALTEFSICVGPNDLVGLIGPNGAGKTTAFNLITGVYPPSAGHILLAGRRIDGLSPVEINHGGVARTFQNIRLFKSLTALDNVAAAFSRSPEHGLVKTVLRTPGYFRERHRSEADATRLLATLGLADDADLRADSLPYGDQRRLEIARALATGPTILLLDEPAAGMNPQEKAELMDLIRFIRDHFGVGVLLIEHDMKLVMGVCERITVLDHGETIAVGTPSEVQANPDVVEAYLGEPTT